MFHPTHSLHVPFVRPSLAASSTPPPPPLSLSNPHTISLSTPPPLNPFSRSLHISIKTKNFSALSHTFLTLTASAPPSLVYLILSLLFSPLCASPSVPPSFPIIPSTVFGISLSLSLSFSFCPARSFHLFFSPFQKCHAFCWSLSGCHFQRVSNVVKRASHNALICTKCHQALKWLRGGKKGGNDLVLFV